MGLIWAITLSIQVHVTHPNMDKLGLTAIGTLTASEVKTKTKNNDRFFLLLLNQSTVYRFTKLKGVCLVLVPDLSFFLLFKNLLHKMFSLFPIQQQKIKVDSVARHRS